MNNFSVGNEISLSEANTKTRPSKSNISSDFETFLKMLTVQMQNQNPLEPIEASDFAVQLATFSSVEQQVRTNEILSRMAMMNDLSNVASWIGKSVLSNAPIFVDDSDLHLVPTEDILGSHSNLIIKDPNGNELRRILINPKRDGFSFNNHSDLSTPLPAGVYNFFVEPLDGGQPSGEIPVRAYARVHEARIETDGISLMLSGGRIINQEDVIGVRE